MIVWNSWNIFLPSSFFTIFLHLLVICLYQLLHRWLQNTNFSELNNLLYLIADFCGGKKPFSSHLSLLYNLRITRSWRLFCCVPWICDNPLSGQFFLIVRIYPEEAPSSHLVSLCILPLVSRHFLFCWQKNMCEGDIILCLSSGIRHFFKRTHIF